MLKSSLQAKILLSVELIVFLVLGTSTLVYIRLLQNGYREAIEWRSEALVQGIVNDALNMLQYSQSNDETTVKGLLGGLSFQCSQIYERYQEQYITHVAVLTPSNTIAAHNDRELWNTPVTEQALLEALDTHQKTTVFVNDVYHSLIPIVTDRDDAAVHFGTIDVGVSKRLVEERVGLVLRYSAGLFVFFLVLAFGIILVLMHRLITKPVQQLVATGNRLATGRPIQRAYRLRRRDEFGILERIFYQISEYFQNIASVASHIADGVLTDDLKMLSEHDILGRAVRRMLSHLQEVSNIMTNIAEGDLNVNVNVRSDSDAFGKALHTMTEGLHTLIGQIRSSAQQLAQSKANIGSQAEQDIHIVKEAHREVEDMLATMVEIGNSVEEVTHNMDMLSTSVKITSESVSQMTLAITHIASNTDTLTKHSQHAVVSLNEAIDSLEGVVQSTESSKQLAQETIEDALEGQQAVEQVMSSMQTIQHTMDSAVEMIQRFEASSHDIHTILDVIREITEQTSLLALNASIIAAQAGSHGRGFAVVADEIKNLANGVGASTKDISQIVQNLQQDTSNMVKTIHAGVSDVGLGLQRTQQAQSTLQKITESARRSSNLVTTTAESLHASMHISQNVAAAMKQVNSMTDDITEATNRQESSTGQINDAVLEINDMVSQIQQAAKQQLQGVQDLIHAAHAFSTLMDRNLSSSQTISKTTNELSSQADFLLQTVERFKLK